jgi:hypothetical protein
VSAPTIITHRINAGERDIAVAAVEVTFTTANAPHALAALNEAVAKARALIDRELPCNTAAPNPEPAHPSALIDDDGDRWNHKGNGVYECGRYTRDGIEAVRAFAGIKTVIP